MLSTLDMSRSRYHPTDDGSLSCCSMPTTLAPLATRPRAMPSCSLSRRSAACLSPGGLAVERMTTTPSSPPKSPLWEVMSAVRALPMRRPAGDELDADPLPEVPEQVGLALKRAVARALGAAGEL